MKEMLKVSIIIPIYKVEKFLTICLESIINQTYRNIEIILVDDGSPDNSGEICDEYAACDSRIKVIHKKNGGVSSARNAGLDIAEGDYIYFIDSDDWIELNALESCIAYLLETGTELCFFNYDQVYEGGKRVLKDIIPGDQEVFHDLDNLDTLYKYMNWTASWNFVFKASLVGNLRFNEELWIGEDTIFKFQLYKKISSFSYLKKVLYHYRIRLNSCTALIYPSLPQIIYKRYHIMSKLIEDGGYPNNAKSVINTIELIRQLPGVIYIAFNGKMSFKCNYKVIEKYIDTAEFKYASSSYNKSMVSKFANYCLLFGSPNRLLITIIYMLSEIKKRILSRKKI